MKEVSDKTAVPTMRRARRLNPNDRTPSRHGGGSFGHGPTRKHLRGDGSLPLETFRGGTPAGPAESGQIPAAQQTLATWMARFLCGSPNEAMNSDLEVGDVVVRGQAGEAKLCQSILLPAPPLPCIWT